MTITGLDVIARSANFESAGNHVDLRPWQWHVLHAFDGRSELRDVAMACGVALEDALQLARETHDAGLISVVSLSLDQYRTWSGIALELAGDEHTSDHPVEAPAGSAVTSDDHFSNEDVLAAYERPVPAWMMEPEPPAAHYDEAPAAHDDEAPAAHHDEAPAAHHDEAPAAHYDEAPAAHYEEAPVPHFDDALTAWHDARPVARDDAAAPQAAEEASAAQAVAHLVSYTWPAPESAEGHAEHAEEPVAEPEPAKFSYSFDETSQEPASGNGHAALWEPMSLVASVDEDRDRVESDSFHDPSMPEGVSILLSSGTPDVVHEPERQEKGSVSFTLSSDDSPATHAIGAAHYDATPQAVHYEVEPQASHYEAEPQAARYEAASQAVHYDLATQNGHYDETPQAMHDDVAPEAAHYDPEPQAAHDDAPVQEHPTAQEPQAAPASVPAGVYMSLKPSNGHPENAPAEPAQAQAPAPASSTTADIVGSLISRALTFRIK